MPKASKTAVKKTSAKKTLVKKAPVKKTVSNKATARKATTKVAGKKAVSKTSAPKAKKLPAKKQPIIPAPEMQPSELTEVADLGTGSGAQTDAAPITGALKNTTPDPYRTEERLSKGKTSRKPVGVNPTINKGM